MNDLAKKSVKICDDHFLLMLSKDKLKAVLQLVGDEYRFEDVQFAEIVKEVQKVGVCFGIVPRLAPAREGRTIIASGKPAREGENARVRAVIKPFVFSRAMAKKPGKDRVDYRELGHIVNVTKGQLLLEKISATDGTPGKNVLGENIPCKPGKDVSIKCGPGVMLSENGLQVTALVDGKFVMGEGKPAVYEEHIVPCNVDMTVGNIAFCGNRLEIVGEVLPGFKIKCKGDVFIGKGVNNGRILAGGNVRIAGGVVGQDTEIRAKGNVRLDFCENFGIIETKGALQVENFMVQGRVKTGGNMAVVSGKGTIIGGRYIIGGSLYVKDLGSDAEVVTEVTIGLKPELEKKKRQIEAAKAFWPNRLTEILKNISALNEMKKTEGKNFCGEKAAVLAELNGMMPGVMEKNNRLTQMQTELDTQLEKATGEAIYVFGILYPGVAVTIGKAVRIIDKLARRVVVELHKSNLQVHVRAMTAEERKSIA